jgi:Protein of unknown function (DUF3035)
MRGEGWFMSGDYRSCGGYRKFPLAAVLCLAGAAMLGGCGELKTAMGLNPNSPDEFAVESRAPLSMPPEFNLRPPEPGAARPQETPADKQARLALDRAGPGKPGEQAPDINLRANADGLAQGAGPQAPDPNAEVGPGTFASRLLDHNDSGAAGAAVDKRTTTPLKDVY